MRIEKKNVPKEDAIGFRRWNHEQWSCHRTVKEMRFKMFYLEKYCCFVLISQYLRATSLVVLLPNIPAMKYFGLYSLYV